MWSQVIESWTLRISIYFDCHDSITLSSFVLPSKFNGMKTIIQLDMKKRVVYINVVRMKIALKSHSCIVNIKSNGFGIYGRLFNIVDFGELT